MKMMQIIPSPQAWSNRLYRALRSLLTVCLLTAYVLPITAQTYEKLWARVRNFEKQGQPQSAYAEIERIRKKAVSEQNAGQETAAILGGYALRQEVSPDSFFTDMLALERRKSAVGLSPVQRAVYASVLGQLYASNRNRSQHNGDAVEAHPDSLREWSRSQYDSAAVANYSLSVADMQVLGTARAADYVPFIIIGEDAGYFKGDLLNVIGRRAATGLSQLSDNRRTTPPSGAAQILSRMLGYYRSNGNEEAELLVTLDSIELSVTDYPVALRDRFSLSSASYSLSPAFRAYTALLNRFAHLPLVCEVYLSMVDRLSLPAEKCVSLLQEGLQHHPSYKRANALRNRINQLEQPNLTVNADGVYPSGNPLKFELGIRNLTRIQATLYRTKESFSKQQLERSRNRISYLQGHAVQSGKWTHIPTAHPGWDMYTDTLTCHVATPGHYILYLQATTSAQTKPSVKETWLTVNVSDLMLLTQTQPDGSRRCAVVRPNDGRPVAGARILVYPYDETDNTLLETYTTDANGTCIVTDRPKGMRLKAVSGPDRYLPPTAIYNYFARDISRTSSDNKEKRYTAIFTDRGIYRPGQQVHVGGFRYTETDNTRQVIANEKVQVVFYDANNKELYKQSVTTDDLGNYSATLTLPRRCLPGTYRIKVGVDRSYYFRVEEYKRPTFRVEFDTPAHYAMGDTLTLTGHVRTFAEAPCRNARITGHYTIDYPYYVNREAYDNGPTPLDTLYTDTQGDFRLKVFLPADTTLHSSGYNVNVYAEALNAAGETQSGSQWLPVGKQAVNLTLQWNRLQNREHPDRVKFLLESLNQTQVEGLVRYALYPVENKTVGSKAVLTGEVGANRSAAVPDLTGLPSGRYQLQASAYTDTDTVTCKQLIMLYSLSDRRPPVDTIAWFQCPVDSFGADAPAHIRVGSSCKDVYLYYQVFGDNRLLEDRLIHFSDSILDFLYTYKPEYGDGIEVSMVFVKDGTENAWRQRIVRPLPDTRLRLSWSTFRDKLQPGKQEEWRVKVMAPDGKPVQASLLAGMYDASLDRLATNRWHFDLHDVYRIPTVYWSSGRRMSGDYATLHFSMPYKKVRSLLFDRFNESLMYSLSFRQYAGTRKVYNAMATLGQAKQESSADTAADTVEESLQGVISGVQTASPSMAAFSNGMKARSRVAKAGAGGSSDEEETVSEDAGVLDTDIPAGALRTNFNEAAFFFPVLRTDADGEVSITFTLPESLTTWNFQGVAHTTDMMTGMLRGTTVAQKDFMVQLHRPRFVRAGDEVALTATINNLTETALKGKVRFEVFDPETDKVLASSKQSFKVEASAETIATFSFRPTDTYDLLACRVVAQSGDFSDGEQYYLPVLPDREWITESVDVQVNGAGRHTVDLSRLFDGNDPDATRRTLTVEYTSHPLWYAIQALPSLDQPAHNDVLSLAAAYYAARLASHISVSTPRLQHVIEQWKADEGNAETLWSRLQQDEELKAIVLSETPWVIQADNETTRKEALATLFDVNTQAARCRELLDKLNGYQYADGSIAWYPGMSRGNEYITLRVTELLARLDRLTGNASTAHRPLLDNALNYLKKENARRVSDMRKAEAQGARITFPGENALKYMYTVLMSGTQLNSSQQRDINYLIDHLAKSVGEIDNMQRALAATVLHLSGRAEQAQTFAVSLEEHLTETPEHGVFFDYPGGSFTTSEAKLNTHIVAMEALMLTRPAETVRLAGMRRWLLQQKRVQMWQSPAVSADAIYVLLQGHTGDLDETGTDKLQLTFTGKSGKRKTQIEVVPDEGNRTEAGLGYLNNTYPRPSEWGTPEMLTIEKSSGNESWGAVYARYLMPIDKIKTASTGLRIRREVNTTTPKTGEKLTTRFVITADRDYEYVMLKAPRAACCEPVAQSSGYRHLGGLGAYVAVHDTSTEFFFERLPKGTYVIETEAYVDRPGSYGTGITVLQCLYAPEFVAHTASMNLNVKH